MVIPAATDGAIEERDFATLEDYQAAVGGRIEAVALPDFGVTIYINERGLLEQLPFNSRASFLWWYHVPEARQKAMLIGEAVVVGLPDHRGNSTDLPAQARSTFLDTVRYRVEVLTFDDPKWYRNQATYPDYWEAIVWGMVLLERWTTAEDVRVVPVEPEEITSQPAA